MDHSGRALDFPESSYLIKKSWIHGIDFSMFVFLTVVYISFLNYFELNVKVITSICIEFKEM